MTKIKVFIDFEAITLPFSNELKISNDFPYAYTLGIYKNKKFSTRTYVFDFSKNSSDNVYEDIKQNIIKDIRKIMHNKTFKVTKSTTEFIGWSANLEKKVLSKIFQKIFVCSLNEEFEVSLSRLTPEFENNYFISLKSVMKNTLDSGFIKRRNLDSDGALAALVGYLLFSKAIGLKGKHYVDIDTITLIKELKEYSKDDVLRMDFLNSNRSLMLERSEVAKNLIKERQKISRDISRKEKMFGSLSTIDKQMTVSDLLDQLKKDLSKLKRDKKKLDQKFNNI